MNVPKPRSGLFNVVSKCKEGDFNKTAEQFVYLGHFSNDIDQHLRCYRG